MTVSNFQSPFKKAPFDWVDSDDWNLIEPANKGTKTNPNKFIVKIGSRQSPDQIIIKLGENLMRELGWKIGDKINFASRSSDLLYIKLFLGNGWTLMKDVGKNTGMLKIRWNDPRVKLEKSNSSEYDFDIYKNSILFRLDQKSTNRLVNV